MYFFNPPFFQVILFVRHWEWRLRFESTVYTVSNKFSLRRSLPNKWWLTMRFVFRWHPTFPPKLRGFYPYIAFINYSSVGHFLSIRFPSRIGSTSELLNFIWFCQWKKKYVSSVVKKHRNFLIFMQRSISNNGLFLKKMYWTWLVW